MSQIKDFIKEVGKDNKDIKKAKDIYKTWLIFNIGIGCFPVLLKLIIKVFTWKFNFLEMPTDFYSIAITLGMVIILSEKLNNKVEDLTINWGTIAVVAITIIAFTLSYALDMNENGSLAVSIIMIVLIIVLCILKQYKIYKNTILKVFEIHNKKKAGLL